MVNMGGFTGRMMSVKKVGWTIIRNGRLLERSILGIMELKI